MGREIEEVVVPWGAPTFFYREGVPLCFLVQRAGGRDGREERKGEGIHEGGKGLGGREETGGGDVGHT